MSVELRIGILCLWGLPTYIPASSLLPLSELHIVLECHFLVFVANTYRQAIQEITESPKEREGRENNTTDESTKAVDSCLSFKAGQVLLSNRKF